MTAVSGAIGSVIGYLGGEVAEISTFERLLWPQRFYNHLGIWGTLKVAVLLPMGGPIHGAALKTLDIFRDNGLYSNYYQGHLLGTAFYADSKLKYYCRSGPEPSRLQEARNSFWTTVLSHVRPHSSPTTDAENSQPKESRPQRARQIVYHLEISNDSTDKSDIRPITVQEHMTTWEVCLGLMTSEAVAIGLAIYVLTAESLIWLGIYLCVPLLLKLGALALSVQRESFAEPGILGSLPVTDLYEIETNEKDFMIIEGPKSIVEQFFLHYGHPKRSRGREIASMLLVYWFVLYFPAGLIGLLWMKPVIQYLWLGYQVYCITAMHVTRALGLGTIGRTEEHLAKLLQQTKQVRLMDRNGQSILASLHWTIVSSAREGKEAVEKIINCHKAYRANLASNLEADTVSIAGNGS